MNTKEFPVSAALSITTGKLLCEFGEMHKLAEWLMGYPIWTHEFGDEQLFVRMRMAATKQHPTLSNCGDVSDKWMQWLIEQCDKLGTNTLPFEQGTEQRTEGPLESLERMAPGKPVIAVVGKPDV